MTTAYRISLAEQQRRLKEMADRMKEQERLAEQARFYTEYRSNTPNDPILRQTVRLEPKPTYKCKLPECFALTAEPGTYCNTHQSYLMSWLTK